MHLTQNQKLEIYRTFQKHFICFLYLLYNSNPKSSIQELIYLQINDIGKLPDNHTSSGNNRSLLQKGKRRLA